MVRILYPRPDYERTDEMGERDVADEVCRNTMLPKVAMLQLTPASPCTRAARPICGLAGRCRGLPPKGNPGHNYMELSNTLVAAARHDLGLPD